MNPITSPVTTSTEIHPATQLGHVHYTVASLERQIGFYQNVLGFKLHWREGQQAGMGAGGEDLLRLTELPGARRVRGATGLYHTAFLLPTRLELAQLLKSIAITHTPIQGMTNHGTHLAIYLPDAEGNGIELAWDFPEAQWPKTAAEMLGRHRGLTPEEVLSVLPDEDVQWQGLDSATKVGHVHLHVSSLPPTDHFYYEVMGFGHPWDFSGTPGGFADTAIFFSAGGYHHHIGTNIWQGEGAPPPPAEATGLRYYTVVLPDQTEVERLVTRAQQMGVATEQTEQGVIISDPAQNHILLTH